MCLSVAQQSTFGLGRLAVEASTSHTHAHPVELLRMSDQLVAEAATYAAHNKQKRRTCMLLAAFEPAIPAVLPRRPHGYRDRRHLIIRDPM